MDILCMKVALSQCIVIAANACGQVLLHLQSTVDNQSTLRLDEFCIVTETLQISFFGAIDIQMIGVCRGDDGHKR